LLLARVETTAPGAPTATQRVAQAPAPRTTPAPRDDRVVVDLGTRGGDPLASIDLERGDVPIDDDGEAVVLTMRGDAAPVIEAAPAESGGDDDPLSALRSAKDLYAWGQARLKEGRYVEAVAAFEDVLGRFSTHDLADNSAYWIGYCHQRRGEHRLAVAEWQKLPARFPRSDKISDALFGMAESHEALGEPVVAEVLYDELVASYPKAERYKDAKKALARLRPQH
jgi:TolA-binding protein